MKKDFANVHISPDGYDKLLSACVLDGSFPATYQEWQQLVADGEVGAAAAGVAPAPVALNVDFFLSWCKLTGVYPTLPALRAFVIIEREGIQCGLTSLSAPFRARTPT